MSFPSVGAHTLMGSPARFVMTSETRYDEFRYICVPETVRSYTMRPYWGSVIELSMVCKIIGHRFHDTFVIRDDGDFFEVEDAQYCRNCGTVHPHLVAN